MKKSNSVNYQGMGFLGWLTLLFITLKLTGFIDWSWWWVLAPFWIPLLLVLVLVIVVGGAWMFFKD